MDGKKSRHSAGNKREDRIWSASDLFDSLNHLPRNHDHHKELNSSEFLELLGKQQGPPAPFRTPRTTTGGSSSKSPLVNAHNKDKDKDRNHNYQSVAIDQCDITSSVDYGSRDYYQTSKHNSDTPYIRKENELDDLYKASTDTRGNWWQGSFYY